MDRRRFGAVTLRAVLAVEDAVQALLVQAVALLGRREVTVLPFVGHGTPAVLHVRARVVLGSPAARAAAAEATAHRGSSERSGPVRGNPAERAAAARAAATAVPADRASDGRAADRDTAVRASADGVAAEGAGADRRGSGRGVRWRILRESLAPFLTVELPRARVVVHGPGGETIAVADRQGYVDAEVAGGGSAPGWRELTVTASWRGHSTAAQVPVLVVDPAAEVGVISDLDDTVIETGLTRGLEFLRLTLLTSVTERAPLPGAAELYEALAARGHGGPRPVFYLSTSPWNLYELLSRFISLRGFPVGPLLLTDWGPSRTHLLRVTAEDHKLTLIRALLAEHPGLRVVLVGDTGQLDPEIYTAVALEAPERVMAVYVRRTSDITAARAVEVGALVRRVAAVGVPMLLVEDSVQIARHAAGIGLLADSDVASVRRATPA